MKKLIKAFLILAIASGCGKSGNKNEEIADPGKASLIKPAQNELCNQGNVVSPTQSIVSFEWKASEHTTSYEINVKDLTDGSVTVNTVNGNKFDGKLKVNTPYSWWVVSKASGTSAVAQSDVFKFYNSGPAIKNYAPFPAELNYPKANTSVSATNGKIALKWIGADVDNDIKAYDIYCSEDQFPALLQANVTTSTIEMAVTAGKKYYWRIITHDSNGNTSDSGVYYFVVKE